MPLKNREIAMDTMLRSEPLPTAMLPYCGRTMMEGLVRDLQAREYLFYRLTGQQVRSGVCVCACVCLRVCACTCACVYKPNMGTTPSQQAT
jgi:hypothetical protein